jgi:hypothetical protein
MMRCRGVDNSQTTLIASQQTIYVSIADKQLWDSRLAPALVNAINRIVSRTQRPTPIATGIGFKVPTELKGNERLIAWTTVSEPKGWTRRRKRLLRNA